MKYKILLIFTILVATVLFVGCQDTSDTEREKSAIPKEIIVVTSIAPVTSIVKSITLNTNIKVQQIVPDNINAHTFSLSQKDIKAIESSKLIIIYSKELEFWAEPFIKQNKNVLILNDHIEDFKPIYVNEGKSIINPHTWLDPICTKKQALEIEKAISKISPKNKDKLSKNANKLTVDLDDLNKYIKELSQKASKKFIITSHPSLVYFFKRYPSGTEKSLQHGDDIEPSISEINSIINEIKQTKEKTLVISEKFINNKIANMIATETNSKEILINTMPNNYVKDMISMAETIYK